MISGETGVGKELVAGALHELSGRKGDLVAVNAAGLDDNVFADTLFGHRKGAFTGADRDRKGLIEQASGGTLFLDEIGDLSPASQVKLLRLLDQREYFPLGADKPRISDARIIVATHHDLDSLKAAGEFRNDLYYRLRTHHIRIPPLRDRLEDIPLLLEHFVEEAARESGKKKPTYHKELIALLQSYHFPGNVRELKAMTFDAVSKHGSKMLSNSSFLEHIDSSRGSDARAESGGAGSTKKWLSRLERLPTLKEISQLVIEEALRRADDNQRVAAKMLGISHQALNQRLRRRKK